MNKKPDLYNVLYYPAVFLMYFFILCFNVNIQAQNINYSRSSLYNTDYPNGFFNKLKKLERKEINQINIVHIGDSHIQADFLTNTIRKSLQSKFGNAGYGFTFPYSLAKTNGTNLVEYKSENIWQNIKNISSAGSSTGLSGISLYTTTESLKIYVSAKDSCHFNTIKLIYPSDNPIFGLAYLSSIYNKTVKVTYNTTPSSATFFGSQYHIVKKGETLQSISRKYKLQIKQLKAMNKLKQDKVAVGTRLIVSKNKTYNNTAKIIKPQVSPIVDEDVEYTIKHEPYVTSFSSNKPLKSTYIVAEGKENSYYLDGVVLENGRQGILYHSIGVNGAKVSDFNKSERFFEQMPILNPDLIIVSLGTNESFGKTSSASFIRHVLKFIQKAKEVSPNAAILFMTPAPSLFNKKNINNYIQDYSNEMLILDECAIWDMLGKVGGVKAPQKKEFEVYMAKDKIHYTRTGYEMLGRLFLSDLLDAYNTYKSKSK